MQEYKSEGILPDMICDETVRLFMKCDYGTYEDIIPSVAASIATQTSIDCIKTFEPLLVAYIAKAKKNLRCEKKDTTKRILYTATALAVEKFLEMNLQELAANYVEKILILKRHIDIESTAFKRNGGIYAVTDFVDKRTSIQELRKRAYSYKQV